MPGHIGFGGSAGSSGSGLDTWATSDGRANAPGGPAQYANILDKYHAAGQPDGRYRAIGGSYSIYDTGRQQPPWMVAGVDYAVGIDKNTYPSGVASLKAPSKVYFNGTQGIPIQTNDTPTIVVPSGMRWQTGDPVWIAGTYPYDRYMVGTVKTYSGTSLVIAVNSIVGSGNLTPWQIAPAYTIWGNEPVNWDGQNLCWINGPAVIDGVDFSQDGSFFVNFDSTNGQLALTRSVTLRNCYFKQTTAIRTLIKEKTSMGAVTLLNCEFDGNNGTQGGTGYNALAVSLDGSGAFTHTIKYCYFHHIAIRALGIQCSIATGGFSWDIQFNVFAENVAAPDYINLHGDVIMLQNSGTSAPGSTGPWNFDNTKLNFNTFYQSNGTVNMAGGEIVFIRDDSPNTHYSGTVDNNTIVLPPVTRPLTTYPGNALVADCLGSNVLKFSALPTNLGYDMIVSSSALSGADNGLPVVYSFVPPGATANVNIAYDAQNGLAYNVTLHTGDVVIFSGGTYPCWAVVQENLISTGKTMTVRYNYGDCRGVIPGNRSGQPFSIPLFLDPTGPGALGSYNPDGSGTAKLIVNNNFNMVTGNPTNYVGGSSPQWRMDN